MRTRGENRSRSEDALVVHEQETNSLPDGAKVECGG